MKVYSSKLAAENDKKFYKRVKLIKKNELKTEGDEPTTNPKPEDISFDTHTLHLGAPAPSEPAEPLELSKNDKWFDIEKNFEFFDEAINEAIFKASTDTIKTGHSFLDESNSIENFETLQNDYEQRKTMYYNNVKLNEILFTDEKNNKNLQVIEIVDKEKGKEGHVTEPSKDKSFSYEIDYSNQINLSLNCNSLNIEDSSSHNSSISGLGGNGRKSTQMTLPKRREFSFKELLIEKRDKKDKIEIRGKDNNSTYSLISVKSFNTSSISDTSSESLNEIFQ